MELTKGASQHNIALSLKRKTVWSRIYDYKVLLLMMLPIVIVQFVNAYLPLFGLFIAFKRMDYSKGIFFSPWVGLDNFKFLIANDSLGRIVSNTIFYNLVFIFGGIILAVIASILLNEIRSKTAAKTYQTVMILPHFLSMVVISYIVFALFAPERGFLTVLMKSFGWEEISWYTEARYWPGILITTKLWSMIGYSCVIYLAAIAGIDQELYEAAYIDGAGKWKQILHITIPMLRPIMVIILIMSLGGLVKGDFGLFYQVTRDSPVLYPTTDVIDTFVYRSLISLQDIGMSSAAGFTQSLVGSFMVIMANWIVRKLDSEQSLF